ncbi:hypothetical protein MMC31_003098 [Peltigera leucophlebia]|nr:hypothetical protein [Peltigera leucophlebia]
MDLSHIMNSEQWPFSKSLVSAASITPHISTAKTQPQCSQEENTRSIAKMDLSHIMNSEQSISKSLVSPSAASIITHISTAKTQSRWSQEENTGIIDFRDVGMNWEEIFKNLPGRSPLSCRDPIAKMDPSRIMNTEQSFSQSPVSTSAASITSHISTSHIPISHISTSHISTSHISTAKKPSKWSQKENTLITNMRGQGMKWEDISKNFPGRSAAGCRLHYQNYLERQSEWDEEKMDKLAGLYHTLKPEMWANVAGKLKVPWQTAEAMHWILGMEEMASRAGVKPFVMAVCKNLPGRSTLSCRLDYQNYDEREWDEKKKNKLASLYNALKPEMWAKVACQLGAPWRTAEAMHWFLGVEEMASPAGVTPFVMAGTGSTPPPGPNHSNLNLAPEAVTGVDLAETTNRR